MTDKELAETVLELLGYERGLGGAFGEDPPFTGTDTWYEDDYLEILGSHGIAAEVKEFMRKKGYVWEEDSQCIGFTKGGRMRLETFANMDEHPRAVCEAAIGALKT